MRIPSADNNQIHTGDKVLVHRTALGNWVGPYRVIDTDFKNGHADCDECQVVMSLDRWKQYKVADEVRDALVNHGSAADVAFGDDAEERTEGYLLVDNF